MLTLAAWYVSLLALVFFFVCLLMMGVILIQKPRGGGLSGAFGGAGGSAQSPFGGRTGDVLTWLTVVLFSAFLLLAIILTQMTKPARLASNNPVVGAPASTEVPVIPPGRGAGATESAAPPPVAEPVLAPGTAPASDAAALNPATGPAVNPPATFPTVPVESATVAPPASSPATESRP